MELCTTYLNFLNIDNFCIIKFKLFWLSGLPVILDNQLSATKTKNNINIRHKYKITFLPHFLEQ